MCIFFLARSEREKKSLKWSKIIVQKIGIQTFSSLGTNYTTVTFFISLEFKMVALIWKFSDSTISNQWGKRWTFFFFFFTVHKRRDCVFISCSCTKRLLKCVAGVDSTITDYLKNTREGNILPKLTLALFEALFIIDALASLFPFNG